MARTGIDERMRRSAARLLQKWESVQVELHGFYSTERFAAMNEYCRSTSSWRALAVLLFTPFPSLIVAAMVDAMPMESVDKGVSSSGISWVRGTLTCFIYTHCAIEQIRLYSPNLNMQLATGFYISVPAAILTNALALALSLLICWPLPFATILMSGPWLGFITFFLLKIRGAHLRANPETIKDIMCFATVCGAQISILLVYAGFSAVFTNMSPSYQPVFALLIPAFKVMQKNILSRILAGRDDTKPQIVILNVEIFNALFIATCMQNSRSIGTSITLILVDLVQASISLLDLYLMVTSVKKIMDEVGVRSNELIATATLILEKSGNHPAGASLKNSQSWMGKSTKRLTRLTFTKKQVLPTMGDSDLPVPVLPDTLTRAQSDVSQDSLSSFTQPGSGVKSAEISFVRPTTGLNRISSQDQHRLLKKALQVLFLTEFMLLVELTEVLVPVIYGGYLVILYHFPNQQYYPQLADITPQELWGMVYSVLGYGLLELGSLVVLLCVLNRLVHRFSLQQLAFVLEREFFMVQPKLILWVTMTMQSSLPQMGVDYSFEFAWIHQADNSTETP